jgi:predicted outer membrane repeat protein
MLKKKRLSIIWFLLLSLLVIIGMSTILIAQAPQAEARATVEVYTEAQLAAAIETANPTDTITLKADITLTGTLPGTGTLPPITSVITLDGEGHYIDGAGSFQVFFVTSDGEFTIQNVTIQNGSAAQGGGLFNDGGTVTVTDSTFSGSTATAYGGGLTNWGGTLTVTGSTFSGNTASIYGGGLFNLGGTLTVTGSMFSGNTTTGPDSYGGGLFNTGGTVTVTNSTFSGNEATSSTSLGGGLFNDGGGTVTVTGSTFSGNTAIADGGGSVCNNTGSTVYLAGVLLDNGSSGGNCSSYGDPLTDNGYNLSDDDTCGFSNPHSLNEASLNLDTLSSGGPGQQVHMPINPSDAIDAIPTGTTVDNHGEPLACDQSTRDQLNHFRPINTGDDCTSGAVELVSLPTLSIDDVSVTEGNSGTTTATFTITASMTSTSDITVQVDTADGTATTADGDYEAIVGQEVTITADTLTTTVGVTIYGDTALEGDETFYVNLSNASSNAVIGDGQGQGTIIGDDALDCVSPIMTEARLDYCIDWANQYSIGPNTLTLGANITLTHTLKVVSSEIVLDGAGYYVDGADTYRAFEVADPGNFTVHDVTIQNGNEVGGGGILLTSGSLTVVDSTFTDNTAEHGGAIYDFDGDTLTVTGSTFTGNTASNAGFGGGAILSFGIDVSVTDSVFTGNATAGSGGAIYDYGGTLTVTDCTFTSNSASENTEYGGGAIYSENDTAAVTGSTFNHNIAVSFGGAIYNASSLTVSSSTFDGNTSAYGAGAIFNGGPLSVDGTSFVDNSAPVYGGAIMNLISLEIINSTFSGNSAPGNAVPNSGFGGAIYDQASSGVTLVYTTFSGNTAGDRGDALASSDPTSFWYLGGVIIENGGGENCRLQNGLKVSWYNFSDDGSCGFAPGNGADNATLILSALTGSGPGQQVHLPDTHSDNVAQIPNPTSIPIGGSLTLVCGDGSQRDQLGMLRPFVTDDLCTSGAVEWDGQVRLSIDDVSVTEGNSGQVAAHFTITALNGPGTGVTVQVDTADDTATTADNDYASIAGQTVPITGATTAVDVMVNGDTVEEPDETFFVNLSAPVNATILDAQGVGTILNDDVDCSIPITTQGKLDACIAWANGHAGPDTLTLGANITLESALTNTIDTEIILDGQSTYYVNGAGSYRVFEVTATGDFTVQNVTLRGGSGSAIYASGALTVTNSTFFNNVSTGHGGAIYSDHSTVEITDNSIFNENMSMDYGGAVYSTHGALTVTDSTFDHNTAGGWGGAIDAEDFSQVDLTGSTFTDNSAGTAGAIYLDSGSHPAAITDSVFTDNEATSLAAGYAGALYNVSSLTITGTTFDGNTAASRGGGAIANAGTTSDSELTIENSSFVNNSATSTVADHGGGAIFTVAPLVITNSTFSGNSLSGNTGGAIYDNENMGATTLIYTTFYGNTATGGGNALGAYDSLTHYNFAGVIIKNGGAGNNCAGSAGVTLYGYNFSDDDSCNFGTGDDALLNLDPLSGSGPGQQVHMPQSGSANIGVIPNPTSIAIGSATFACNGTQDDQIGTRRPPSGSDPCTSGAVEFVSLPTLSIDDVSGDEGDADNVRQFTITASKTWGTDITVQVDVVGGTATAGSDYTVLTPQTATITAGNLTTTVDVTIIGDTTVELNEQYTVNLSNPSGATIADGQGLGTIINDDSATLSITGATVNPEGTGGPPVYAVFNVTLSDPVDTAVSVYFATADFTATAGADYIAVSGTLDMSSGSGQISVEVVKDALDEDDNEWFTVALSNLQAGGREAFISISGSPAEGHIIDDDAPPTVSINDMNVPESNGTATFTVSLSAVSGRNVTVNASTHNGTAVSGSDFTGISNQLVSILAGSISAPLAITILEDNIYEGTENYTVELTNPVNATLGDATGLGEITDNDPQPTISINDVTGDEGDSGSTPFNFTVTLTNPSSQSITVHVSTADGTATTADNDYQPLAADPIFTPGQTTQPVTVNVNGDTDYELDETFMVNLSGASGATIGDSQGVGTILNDDTAPQFVWEGGPIIAGCEDKQTRITVKLENMTIGTEYTVESIVHNGSGYYMSRSFTQPAKAASGEFIVVLFSYSDFEPGPPRISFPIVGPVEVETRIWNKWHTLDLTDFIVHGYECDTGYYSEIEINP